MGKNIYETPRDRNKWNAKRQGADNKPPFSKKQDTNKQALLQTLKMRVEKSKKEGKD